MLQTARSIVLVPVVLAGPALAGDLVGEPIRVRGESCGLRAEGGGFVAGGPGYAARFGGKGLVFTPALGSATEGDRPLAFHLESIARGAAERFRRAGALAPRRAGMTVRYELAPGWSETYEVRPEGVEQRFVFEELPAGSGDLVVRGRVGTDLPRPAPGLHRGGLGYEVPGLGGVRFGPVTGIDATGARCEGWLRAEGEHLELGLPGAFVDRARPG